MALRINPHFVKYISENLIVFVSGCNVILYNFETKEQIFIPRKTTQRSITYLSVGHLKPLKSTESNSIFTSKSKNRSSFFNVSF